MARSAKRRRKSRQQGALQQGAVALGHMISQNPVLVGGSTAFLVTLFYVSANALWYQPFPHRTAFFTTRAIQSFPQAAPVEPETTINIDRSPQPVVSAPAQAPVPTDPVLQQVQGALKALGFYSGAVDGLAGPATRAAIESYQRKVGLGISGNVDGALLRQLGLDSRAPAIPKPTSRTNAAERADTTGAIKSSAQQSAAPAPAPLSANARIIRIQAGLRAFGNDDIQLDGVVGARTRAAIKEFQALFGLPETGEPDEAVYVKMRQIGLTS
jgi:peptidoglycan hydrolase-like protein with peptidoglycan-binding domain